jgi:hypothetical protein
MSDHGVFLRGFNGFLRTRSMFYRVASPFGKKLKTILNWNAWAKYSSHDARPGSAFLMDHRSICGFDESQQGCMSEKRGELILMGVGVRLFQGSGI